MICGENKKEISCDYDAAFVIISSVAASSSQEQEEQSRRDAGFINGEGTERDCCLYTLLKMIGRTECRVSSQTTESDSSNPCVL